MENRAKRELARKRLIIHSVLCAVLPPLGMLLVWRSRYQSRMKLLMTLGATLVLMVMFSIGLSMREPEPIVPPAISASYSGQTTEAEPTPAPAAEPTPAPAVIDEGFVAPANPNG